MPDLTLATLPTSVGIELEVSYIPGLCPDRPCATYRGQPCSGAGLENWKFKTDASCGYEMVSPIFQAGTPVDVFAEAVNTAVNWLKQYNAQVNRHCGLHVHLGVRYLTAAQLKRATSFFVRYEGAFFALAAEHRRVNHYAAPLGSSILQRIKASVDPVSAWLADNGGDGNVMNDCDRYHWLNLLSYAKFGTLELRVQESTLNVADIAGWTALVAYALDYVARVDSDARRATKSSTDYPALLLHHVLTRGGFYGSHLNNQTPALRACAIVGREWATGRYKQLHGIAHRRVIADKQKAKKPVRNTAEQNPVLAV